MAKRISLSIGLAFFCLLNFSSALAAVPTNLLQPPPIKSPLRGGGGTGFKGPKSKPQKVSAPVPASSKTVFTPVDQGPYFDLPITYNSKVRNWIRFFQYDGRKDFRKWLERSARYIPKITPTLEDMGMPKDLAYLAMIESGFSSQAVSAAAAVGYWQFIAPTAKRYGLQVDWWIDERRDIIKSTVAAAAYLNDLYKMFNSWYLAAAAYNMGEGRVKKLIKKYQTTNYWELAKKRDFPQETENYIPKLIAAMLIAKAPNLYGFTDLQLMDPLAYDHYSVPGGTDLENLAHYIGYDKKLLRQLNPELVKGFVPQFITAHRIRIPKGMSNKVSQFVR